MIKLAIHSVPRSGSSWLGEIVNSSPLVQYRFQPLFSYAHKNRLNQSSSRKAIQSFFDEINKSKDDFVLQTQARLEGKKPNFLKTEVKCIAYKEVRYHNIIENMLKQDPEVKVIGLIRNPLAVMASWFNAPREFRKDLHWKEKEELFEAAKKNQGRKEEFFGLDKWFEVSELFERLAFKYPERFLIVEYQDLVKKRVKEVARIFKFLDLPVDEQTLNFIGDNKKHIEGTYSVSKIKSSDDLWEENLSPDIKALIIESVRLKGLERYMYKSN